MTTRPGIQKVLHPHFGIFHKDSTLTFVVRIVVIRLFAGRIGKGEQSIPYHLGKQTRHHGRGLSGNAQGLFGPLFTDTIVDFEHTSGNDKDEHGQGQKDEWLGRFVFLTHLIRGVQLDPVGTVISTERETRVLVVRCHSVKGVLACRLVDCTTTVGGIGTGGTGGHSHELVQIKEALCEILFIVIFWIVQISHSQVLGRRTKQLVGKGLPAIIAQHHHHAIGPLAQNIANQITPKHGNGNGSDNGCFTGTQCGGRHTLCDIFRNGIVNVDQGFIGRVVIVCFRPSSSGDQCLEKSLLGT
mmetsp:Transcript_110/g.325  ORF Transcript_110/g.325 Transcript_110/m.325 type:complete len:299 (-) Transcript_110:757-1653(-)